MLNPAAILFDYDGVIGDTAEDNISAWTYALEPFGAKLQPRDFFVREGMILSRISAVLLELYGADPVHAPEVVKRREEWARAHHKPKLFPDAVELVGKITASGIKTAVVSAASRERLMHPSLAGIRASLSAVISSHDCREGKPSPEPYLMGARELGVEPSRCVVVENAPLGVQSARSAGMICVAVTTTVSAQDLSQADYIISRLGELSGLLALKG